MFCNSASGDFTLDVASPCMPGNHPQQVACGSIGAEGQGCTSMPTRQESWGSVKSRF